MTSRIVWQGEFGTWAEACRASGSPDGTFSSDRWFQRITDTLTEYRSALGAERQPLPPRPSNLPWVSALTEPRTIVDFGGASGWGWDYVRRSVPDLQVDAYVVVESPAVVEFMKASALQTPPVRHATSDENLPEADLLYCNSVLQYFGSNDALLDLAAKTRPRCILLDDLIAAPDDDWFSHQLYYAAAIPHRFVGLTRLIADLAGAGYRVALQAAHPSPVFGVLQPLPMDNFPAHRRIPYATSALLVARTARG